MPKWPKTFPPLTEEQIRISNDFMEYWHDVLISRFNFFNRFNHYYPAQHSPPDFLRTLEIGAGLGEHLEYEKQSLQQEVGYVACDIRENMVQRIRQRFPRIQVIVGDIQKGLDFPDGHFDRLLAIHTLEHLHNLPAAIRELYRLCDKRRGVFLVVIPCEGGLANALARRISAKRIFEKRYHQSYDWFIKREHVNTPAEVLEELAPYFQIVHCSFFPLQVPLIFCNLAIGLTLYPRN